MNALEAPICPECNSALIDDIQCGEVVCSSCGVVVEQQTIDFGPEATRTSYEDKMSLARATGKTTYSQHDLGINTVIASGTRDCNGQSIGSETASTVKRMREWQKRVRVNSNSDRRLVVVLEKINEACKFMSLPDNVLETASMIYRNLDREAIKGSHIDSMSVATIYLACQRCEVVRSLEEICRSICAPPDVRAKTKLAAKYYRRMRLNMETVPPSRGIAMGKYISQISNITKIDTRVERLALELASKTSNGSFADGKTPKGIAASYLYVASILRGQNVLQRDISSVAHVTEVTIRNRCKDLLSNYRVRITLAPTSATN